MRYTVPYYNTEQYALSSWEHSPEPLGQQQSPLRKYWAFKVSSGFSQAPVEPLRTPTHRTNVIFLDASNRYLEILEEPLSIDDRQDNEDWNAKRVNHARKVWHTVLPFCFKNVRTTQDLGDLYMDRMQLRAVKPATIDRKRCNQQPNVVNAAMTREAQRLN